MNNDINPPKRVRSEAMSQEQPRPQQNPEAIEPEIGTNQTEPTPPKKRSKIRVFIAIITGLILALLAALVIGFLWYQQNLKAVEPGSNTQVTLTVEEGSTTTSLAALLKDKGLIRSETAFRWYVKLNGSGDELQAGAYRISKGADVESIVGDITSGKTDTFTITFLPGATLADNRKALVEAGYNDAEIDTAFNKSYDHPIFAGKPASADLEGYIYGETYKLGASASVEDVLVYSFDQMYQVVEENGLVAKYKKQGLSLFEGITLASIIQREVSSNDPNASEDQRKVAQVFYLRLEEDMPLGSDVTYQYIADKTNQQRDPELDSPYNTRRYKRLPPGPISAPGSGSLIGAATPAKGDNLFFLSGDDDITYFGRTNAEHEANIKNHCQEKCKIL